MIEGSGGVFEVKLNGELIFSKRATGHFPDEDQLLKDIESKL